VEEPLARDERTMNTSRAQGRSYWLSIALVMTLYLVIPLLSLAATITGGSDGWQDLQFVATALLLIMLASIALALLGALGIRYLSESHRGIAKGLLVGIVPGFIVGLVSTVVMANLAWY